MIFIYGTVVRGLYMIFFPAISLLTAYENGMAATDVTARRLLRWLALRGSPPGNRALPDMSVIRRVGQRSGKGPRSAAECRRSPCRPRTRIGDNQSRRQTRAAKSG